jgi:hypothetical protein
MPELYTLVNEVSSFLQSLLAIMHGYLLDFPKSHLNHNHEMAKNTQVQQNQQKYSVRLS